MVYCPLFADLIRLIKDPTVNQIQLVGDITFSSDLFPPEHENIIERGINVSHVVSASDLCLLPFEPPISSPKGSVMQAQLPWVLSRPFVL
jgi:hypothetical protein